MNIIHRHIQSPGPSWDSMAYECDYVPKLFGGPELSVRSSPNSIWAHYSVKLYIRPPAPNDTSLNCLEKLSGGRGRQNDLQTKNVTSNLKP